MIYYLYKWDSWSYPTFQFPFPVSATEVLQMSWNLCGTLKNYPFFWKLGHPKFIHIQICTQTSLIIEVPGHYMSRHLKVTFLLQTRAVQLLSKIWICSKAVCIHWNVIIEQWIIEETNKHEYKLALCVELFFNIC